MAARLAAGAHPASNAANASELRWRAACCCCREEVVGRNCRMLQGPGTDPEAVARLREALAAVRPVTVTLLNYTKV